MLSTFGCPPGEQSYPQSHTRTFRVARLPSTRTTRRGDSSGLLHLAIGDQNGLRTDFFGVKTKLPCLHVAMVANDEIEQDNTGLFAFHPISQTGKWNAAMFTDPSHALLMSKGYAICPNQNSLL